MNSKKIPFLDHAKVFSAISHTLQQLDCSEKWARFCDQLGAYKDLYLVVKKFKNDPIRLYYGADGR